MKEQNEADGEKAWKLAIEDEERAQAAMKRGQTRRFEITRVASETVRAFVREISGKERNRVFVYKKFIDILSDGTSPP